jgi:alpha-amylase
MVTPASSGSIAPAQTDTSGLMGIQTSPNGGVNGVMMQYFEWYLPQDGQHWNKLAKEASTLAAKGFTALWIPPCYKGSGGGLDVGYSTYDLYDLGEFDQKGSIRTKYGTKAELLAAVAAAHAAGIQIYADTVFNHKNGGDVEETIEAVPVYHDNRNASMGGVEQIRSWTQFNFPGRGSQYSAKRWSWRDFDSVNHNMHKPGDSTIYRFKDKQFETEVNPQHGNYDFLMACDLDTSVPEVVADLNDWGQWICQTAGVDGFRLDAVKHVRASFFKEWLEHVRSATGKNLFAVGEYWSQNLQDLFYFLDQTGGQVSLFDVPLHYNFHQASKAGGNYDMRYILKGTLMEKAPLLAVTFVENHDSQPLQALESVVEPWFKPLAYALILLRTEGYPCVFYGDYYGGHYVDKGRDGRDYEVWLNSHQWIIDRLLYARQHYAHGPQYDYFDHWDLVGWTRLGNAANPKAMAVLLSDGPGGSKWMEVGKPHTTFIDFTQHVKTKVVTNEHGWGEFSCNGGSVSVWLQE